MSLIRTFLAIPIPKEVKGYLKVFLDPMKDRNDQINWVKRENIHITLNFLGDTNPENIEDHSKQLESLIQRLPTFELGTTDTGVFPHANEPRVLWIGTAPWDTKMAEFKLKLDQELKQMGYQLDKRPFQPHITLGRVKSISRKSSFIHNFLSADVHEMDFEVTTVKWIKSILTPTGAEYEELKTFKFNAGGQ